jgi:hypothetical protein
MVKSIVMILLFLYVFPQTSAINNRVFGKFKRITNDLNEWILKILRFNALSKHNFMKLKNLFKFDKINTSA